MRWRNFGKMVIILGSFMRKMLNRKKLFLLIFFSIFMLVLFSVLIVRVLFNMNFIFLVLDVLVLVSEICLFRLVVGMIFLVRLIL